MPGVRVVAGVRGHRCGVAASGVYPMSCRVHKR
jgi:hypothetical protein